MGVSLKIAVIPSTNVSSNTARRTATPFLPALTIRFRVLLLMTFLYQCSYVLIGNTAMESHSRM